LTAGAATGPASIERIRPLGDVLDPAHNLCRLALKSMGSSADPVRMERAPGADRKPAYSIEPVASHGVRVARNAG